MMTNIAPWSRYYRHCGAVPSCVAVFECVNDIRFPLRLHFFSEQHLHQCRGQTVPAHSSSSTGTMRELSTIAQRAAAPTAGTTFILTVPASMLTNSSRYRSAQHFVFYLQGTSGRNGHTCATVKSWLVTECIFHGRTHTFAVRAVVSGST